MNEVGSALHIYNQWCTHNHFELVANPKSPEINMKHKPFVPTTTTNYKPKLYCNTAQSQKILRKLNSLLTENQKNNTNAPGCLNLPLDPRQIKTYIIRIMQKSIYFNMYKKT